MRDRTDPRDTDKLKNSCCHADQSKYAYKVWKLWILEKCLSKQKQKISELDFQEIWAKAYSSFLAVSISSVLKESALKVITQNKQVMKTQN